MSEFPLPNILEFLKEVIPFNTLEQEVLLGIIPRIDIAFYPKGRLIIKMGARRSRHLYIIQAGSARVTITDESGTDILVDIRGKGDTFGAISLLLEKEGQFNVTADEDVIAFLVPAKVLKTLIDHNPSFKQYFDASLARNFQAVKRAVDDQLSLLTKENQLRLDMFLTGKRVSELMTRDVLTCRPDTTAQQVATRMRDRRVGSALVLDMAGGIAGIITDTDIRNKIVADSRSYNTAARDIMNAPVHTISTASYAFDALLDMSRYGIGHLAVMEGNHLVGIISEYDFQLEIGSSPIGVIGDIDTSDNLEKLIALRPKIDNILEMGLRRSDIVWPMVALIAELNDRVTRRIIRLIEKDMAKGEHGPPPVPYCWLAMGSEGRLEQTLHTDQDNALLYEDIPDKSENDRARQWFLAFSQRIVDTLVDFGIPRCKGGIMASNPQWCQQRSDWEKTFLKWIENPSPLALRMASIFFDFRGITPENPSDRALRQFLNRAAQRNSHFLRKLAKNALYNKPPLGFLRHFVVEKSGDHKNALNLKLNGLAPVADAARVMALDLGLTTTNTLARLEEITDHKVLDPAFFAELKEAYDCINYIRIHHHLKSLDTGRQMDNYLDPASLNHFQRKMLKECFTVVSRLQDLLASKYQTQFVMES